MQYDANTFQPFKTYFKLDIIFTIYFVNTCVISMNMNTSLCYLPLDLMTMKD